MDDGAYHEEDEQAEQLRLKVQDIVAVEWATSHSLGLGANVYTPALVMHVIKPTAGDAINGQSGLLTGLVWDYAFTMLCSDMCLHIKQHAPDFVMSAFTGYSCNLMLLCWCLLMHAC